jgi:hypothetical protein
MFKEAGGYYVVDVNTSDEFTACDEIGNRVSLSCNLAPIAERQKQAESLGLKHVGDAWKKRYVRGRAE